MLFKKLKLIFFIFKINRYTYERVYLNQRKKGIRKYRKPLEECNLKDYNWKEMLLEEVIDAFQYQDMMEKSSKIKQVRKKLF